MVNHENDKLVSALSYILVGIIWYFVDDKVKNKNTNFHVKQALNLFVIYLIFNIAFSILTIITLGFLTPVIALLSYIVGIILLILWIIGLIYAIQEEKKEIPVIGQFASRYLNFK